MARELEYEIYEMPDTGNRILVVTQGVSNCWRFYQIINRKRVTIHFKQAHGKCIALTSGKILAFKKPHPSKLHREIIRRNSRCMWDGSRFDVEQVISSMMEFDKAI